MWTAGGRREKVGRRLQAKARKHDLIRGLAESKLNTMADRISVALNDDKITEEEFRLILSEVDKYNQMKTEIRGRQKQSLSEDEKNRLFQRARDEAMMTARAKLLKEIQAGKKFRLILSEVDKYNQMKTEIRGRQKQSFSEDEKNRLFQHARDEAMITARAKLLKEIQAGTSSGT